MAIDARFINISDLISYFVDKTTGLPLAGGYVKFYSENDRITPKPVYILDEVAPDVFNYVTIGSTVNLGIDGTPVYNSNSVTVFYYPFEGLPAADTKIPEYYFVEIYAQDNTLQATRNFVPYVDVTGTSPINETNLIANSQFLTFNNKWPIISPYVESDGAVTYNVYPLAQGGIEFAVYAADAPKYSITQSRPSTPPNAFADVPYGLVTFINTQIPTSTVHDFRVKIQDVYTLTSPSETRQYTFYIAAQSGDAFSYTFDVKVLLNYGTGGTPSTPEYIDVGNVTITPASQYVQQTINLPPIVGKVLGTNNDDFMAIILRAPISTFNAKIFEWGLLAGVHTVDATSVLNPALQSETRANAIAGWMPTPATDGSDLYLNLILTPQGLKFDDSQIGFVQAYPSEDVPVGWLACDGTSYDADGYSPLGIPFKRLRDKLWNSSLNTLYFGTGREFIQSQLLGDPSNNKVLIHTNNSEINTIAVDVSTTMTFATSNIGFVSNVIAQVSSNFQVAVLNKTTGAINDLYKSGVVNTTPFNVLSESHDLAPYRTFINTTNTVLNNQYFILGSPGLPALTPFYYVWYVVDNGTPTDPNPVINAHNGIGIRVNVLSTYTANDVAVATASAINGFTTSLITTKAGSAIPQSSYFTINTFSTDTAYVWFNVDNGGTDPGLAGNIDVEVDILSTDTATQVANKMIIAINRRFVGVPDLRGCFIRGWKNGSVLDSSIRYSYNVFNLTGDHVGGFEFDNNLSHNHNLPLVTSTHVQSTNAGTLNYLIATDQLDNSQTISSNNAAFDGANESVPKNISLAYIIKY